MFFLDLIYSVDIVDEEPHFVGYSAINHYYYYYYYYYYFYCSYEVCVHVNPYCFLYDFKLFKYCH